MREAVIVSTARTPIGRAYRGAFNDTQAQQLGFLGRQFGQQLGDVLARPLVHGRPELLAFGRERELRLALVLLAACAGETVPLLQPLEQAADMIAAAQNPNLDPEWPVSVSIPGWTTYSMDEIIACKGPGE